MRKLLLSLIFCIGITVTFAQVDINYWDKVGYIQLGGGMVYPGNGMKSTLSNGLYAKNGFQLVADFNYIIKYGIGVGLNIEFNDFLFNKNAFLKTAQPESMYVDGDYTSTKVGLNILMNLPIIVSDEKFVLNMYGEINPGLRGFNIPSIDLFYNENLNKYIEVHYRTRKNFMGYIGYSAGLQMLFSDKWGINLSYNSLFQTRHSIKYSVRMFDAFGNLYEDEKYLNNYLNHSGWQVGFMFLFGKN